MKVFMSWSGVRSHLLADALHDWMPLVLHYVETWLSKADIEAGQRWADQVARELEASNFGILCITKENVASPWVLFEAGALAKSMQGSRVVPFLLDLEFSDITGPLAQFQAKKVDRAGVFEVVQSLNQLAQTPVPEDRVRQLFEALWPELEKKVSKIPPSTTPEKHTRPQAEVMEELVASIRTLEGRFRELDEDRFSDDDPLAHWLVLCQSTLEYTRDTLLIADGVEQLAMFEQLKRLSAYLKIVVNLISPKLKSIKVGSTYLTQINKLHKQITVRIEELAPIFDDEEL